MTENNLHQIWVSAIDHKLQLYCQPRCPHLMLCLSMGMYQFTQNTIYCMATWSTTYKMLRCNCLTWIYSHGISRWLYMDKTCETSIWFQGLPLRTEIQYAMRIAITDSSIWVKFIIFICHKSTDWHNCMPSPQFTEDDYGIPQSLFNIAYDLVLTFHDIFMSMNILKFPMQPEFQF